MATTDSGLICYSTIDVKQPATSLTIKEDKILKVVKGYSCLLYTSYQVRRSVYC